MLGKSLRFGDYCNEANHSSPTSWLPHYNNPLTPGRILHLKVLADFGLFSFTGSNLISMNKCFQCRGTLYLKARVFLGRAISPGQK
jgi:hypothetical protein